MKETVASIQGTKTEHVAVLCGLVPARYWNVKNQDKPMCAALGNKKNKTHGLDSKSQQPRLQSSHVRISCQHPVQEEWIRSLKHPRRARQLTPTTVNNCRFTMVSHGFTPTGLTNVTRVARRQAPIRKTKRSNHILSAVNEADNLYKGIPVAAGIIEKRLMEKQMQKSSKEFMAAIKLAEDDDRKVQLLRREARQAPAEGDHQGLVEYFLNTVGGKNQITGI